MGLAIYLWITPLTYNSLYWQVGCFSHGTFTWAFGVIRDLHGHWVIFTWCSKDKQSRCVSCINILHAYLNPIVDAGSSHSCLRESPSPPHLESTHSSQPYSHPISLDIPPLSDTEVWIRQHPSSPKASGYDNQASTSTSQAQPKQQLKIPIFFPFRTYTDFLQAEVFCHNNCSDGHINEQLGQLHKTGAYQNSPPSERLTLKTASDYHAALALASGASNQVCLIIISLFNTVLHKFLLVLCSGDLNKIQRQSIRPRCTFPPGLASFMWNCGRSRFCWKAYSPSRRTICASIRGGWISNAYLGGAASWQGLVAHAGMILCWFLPSSYI